MVDPLENPNYQKIAREDGNGDGDGDGDDIDRFSKLPECILHYILSLLDTLDVVRASAVSRKWRYIWLSLPCLTFNKFHKVWADKRKKFAIHTVNDEFKDFVNWVLMSQSRSARIKTVGLYGLHIEPDDYSLYRWLNILARRKVEELDLIIYSETPIVLPLCLVNCESLLSFKLCFGCDAVLKLPKYPGFSRLRSLDLTKIEFSDYIALGNFISNCCLLEDLNLQRCVFRDFKILEICNTSLKNLTLNNRFSGTGGDGLRSCELKVACPNLLSFNFLGPSAREFIFQHLNSLEKMFFSSNCLPVHATDNESHRVMRNFFEGLGSIKVLKLTVTFEALRLELIHILVAHLDCLFVTSRSLKSLKLSLPTDSRNMDLVLCWLGCCPNLEALTICFVLSDFNGLKLPDRSISCLINHLKVVELFEVQGNKNEFELVRFLLKHGQVLQKMSISWVKEVQDSEELIEEVMKFPQTSSNVVLTFHQPKSDIDFLKL